MKLEKIKIENYKSIENLEFEVFDVEKSKTYSLLGINESGKSSFLKAISLVDNDIINYPDDYFNDSKSVIIKFIYTLTTENLSELKKMLSTQYGFSKELLGDIIIDSVELTVEFEPINQKTKNYYELVNFKNIELSNYTQIDNLPIKRTKEHDELPDFNLTTFFAGTIPNTFRKQSHKVVFWESTPEYLKLDEIDLIQFSNSPRSISIPLLNCFILSGINEESIKTEIAKLTSPVHINSLQSKLSELTTQHINKVWPEHPISISFQINNNKISLLVEDNGIKFQPKTAGQRSDGFKQFISFLLTVSAENHNGELSNTILLIDEPETHLHPPAQINLLRELIKITSNENNNILFFATHSNYLIDKVNLDRNHKVSKRNNQKTSIDRIEKKTSTYSEVNYEIFNIETSDYHNELYGYIESENRSLLDNLDKDFKWIHAKTKKDSKVSLCEYIRHSIHHPENNLNKKFSEKELSQSIKKLRELREQI